MGTLETSGETSSFTTYRVLLESGRFQTIEAPGIIYSDLYADALEDQSTISVIVEGQEMPLITPHKLSGWDLSPGYWARVTGDDRIDDTSIRCLTLPPDEYVLTPGEITKFRTLGDNKGLLLVDAITLMGPPEVDSGVTTRLDSMLGKLGLRGVEIVSPEKGSHYQYESKLTQPDRKTATTTDAVKAMFESYSGPEIGKSLETSLVVEMSDDDVEQVIGFYNNTHKKISGSDPVKPYYSDPEVERILKDKTVVKSVAKNKDGRIINVCFFSEVHDAILANHGYLKQKYPEEYESGNVLFFHGVFTNMGENERRQVPMASLMTMGLIARLIKESAQEPIIVFACNEVSRKNVPWLAEKAIRGTGLDCSYSSPTSIQTPRLFAIQPR